MDCEDAVAAVIAETDRDILRIEERQECMKGGQSACVCDSRAAKKRAKDCLQARSVWCCDARIYMAFCFCFRGLNESISFIPLRKTASDRKGSSIPRHSKAPIECNHLYSGMWWRRAWAVRRRLGRSGHHLRGWRGRRGTGYRWSEFWR